MDVLSHYTQMLPFDVLRINLPHGRTQNLTCYCQGTNTDENRIAAIIHDGRFGYHKGLQMTGWWFLPTRPERFIKVFLRDTLILPLVRRAESRDGAICITMA